MKFAYLIWLVAPLVKRNSLRGLLPKQSEVLDDIIFGKRPEQLSVEEFINLTRMIKAAQP